MNNAEKTRLQKEIIDGLDYQPKGRLLLAPRIGKTKLGIDLIKREKPESILWVTPEKDLGESIVKEFEFWKAKKYVKKLKVSTWKSLNKIEGHFDLIIWDEEQHATRENTVNFFNNTVTYDCFISMTGTPTKHFDKMLIYNQLGLKTLYELKINEAVDFKLLSDYSIKVVKVDMSTDKNIEVGSKDKKFLTSEKSQYIYLNNVAEKAIYDRTKNVHYKILARMRAIKNSSSKLNVAKYLMSVLEGRKMFFCSGISQAESVCNNFYHSKTNNEKLIMFKNGEIDEIALVNAGGTGHTYKKIDHLVIVQADSDKNGLTSQKVTRTLLAQKDYKANIWFICLKGTKDEDWIASTLSRFDESKIEFVEFKNMNL